MLAWTGSEVMECTTSLRLLRHLRQPKDGSMKKNNDAQAESVMRDDYDFSGAVRGKHYRAYRAGHSVRIHTEDGKTDVFHFTLEDGAVMLDPDVKSRFPTPEAVNRALRAVMAHGYA